MFSTVLARLRAFATHRALWLTLAALCLYGMSFDNDWGAPDERQRFDLAVAIARDGLKALKSSGGISKYPPLQSLLMVWPVKLGMKLDHGLEGMWTERWATFPGYVAAALIVPMFYAMCRLLDAPKRRASVIAAAFALTNPLWPYARRLYSEPVSAVLVFGVFLGVTAHLKTRRRLPLYAGLSCLALLPLNNMVAPVAVTIGLVCGTIRHWRVAAKIFFTAAIGGAFAWKIGLLRQGGVPESGYGNEHFTFHVFEGTWGLLFSPGRSVFVFAPMVFAALWGWRRLGRAAPELTIGALVAMALQLAMISAWWCWWGGWCWGPRLLVSLMPVASLGVIPLFVSPQLESFVGLVFTTVFGFWVQVVGVAFPRDFDTALWLRADASNEFLLWFTPEHSPLYRIPKHFKEHPWDMSSVFIALKPTGPSTITLGSEPVSRVRIQNDSDELHYFWSIADIFVVRAVGNGTERVTLGSIGGKFESFNRNGDPNVLDGDPSTRWSSSANQRAGTSVSVDFGKPRTDVVRLEIEHMPYDRDFPGALSAKASADAMHWRDVPAHAGVPEVTFKRGFYFLLVSALLSFAIALRRAPRPPKASRRDARKA
jgi:hypothetical protein